MQWVSRLSQTSAIELETEAVLDGTQLTGNVQVVGPKIGSPQDLAMKPLVVQVVVAERGVVFHGFQWCRDSPNAGAGIGNTGVTFRSRLFA